MGNDLCRDPLREGGNDNNLSKEARKFRKRFFIWSGLVLAFLLILSELWFFYIMSEGPLVESPDQNDITVIEAWLGMPLPEGTILQKMQCYLGFLDNWATSYVQIPARKLEQFMKGLPDNYVLYTVQSNTSDYSEYDNEEEGELSYIRIYYSRNGYCEVHIVKCADGVIVDLFRKYMKAGKFKMDADDLW